MLALDTNILLYVLTNHSEFAAPATEILQGKYGANLQTSDLIIVELLSHESVKSLEEYGKVNQFIHAQLFTHLPIKEPVLHKAADLRRDYNLKLADAIHIASAIINKADYFITNDRGLLKKYLPDITLVGLTKLDSLESL